MGRVPAADLRCAEPDEQVAVEALVGGDLRVEVECLGEPPDGVSGSDLGEGLVTRHLAVGDSLGDVDRLGGGQEVVRQLGGPGLRAEP